VDSTDKKKTTEKKPAAAKARAKTEKGAAQKPKKKAAPAHGAKKTGKKKAEDLGVKRAVAEAISTLGRVDILVNNAGAVKGGDFLTLPDDEWIRGWNLKLLGYIRMAREVLPHMQQQRSGRIINIAGVAARNPATTFMAGGAANAALINFTKSLADLAAKSNVLVNAVSPGLVRTERFESLLKQRATAEGKDFETLVKEQTAEYPLGRIATPEEIANLVTFLASERASFMAGVTITVDGGVSRGVYM
jgi:NAD(P)-dependent dehydrogenase (short-subunit alcohol dehydrogenase family)